MKRKTNLYQNIYKIDNIMKAFDEVCKNTKNREKKNKFKQYRCIYVSRIYNILKNKKYILEELNVFKIYEPKERRIVSLGMQDKVINHLIARYILIPAIFPGLIDEVVSGRVGKGTSKGIELEKTFIRKCNVKYEEYYILKCDISKFFASIDHTILKNKLKRKIKEKDSIDIVEYIIDTEEKRIKLRKYDITDISNILSKRHGSFYKRKIKNKVLCKISR